MCVCACVSARAWVRACVRVRAWVRAWVRACASVFHRDLTDMAVCVLNTNLPVILTYLFSCREIPRWRPRHWTGSRPTWVNPWTGRSPTTTSSRTASSYASTSVYLFLFFYYFFTGNIHRQRRVVSWVEEIEIINDRSLSLLGLCHNILTPARN